MTSPTPAPAQSSQTLSLVSSSAEPEADEASAYLVYFSYAGQIVLAKKRNYAVRLVKSSDMVIADEQKNRQVMDAVAGSDGQ